MPTVRFSGQVLPLAHRISLEDVPINGWQDTSLGLTMNFLVSLRDSVISISAT